MNRAIEPELIQWENNGNTSDKKCKRGTAVLLIALLILISSFSGIGFLSIQEKRRKQWIKSDCNLVEIEITKELAETDYLLGVDAQKGLMHCYC